MTFYFDLVMSDSDVRMTWTVS